MNCHEMTSVLELEDLDAISSCLLPHRVNFAASLLGSKTA